MNGMKGANCSVHLENWDILHGLCKD